MNTFQLDCFLAVANTLSFAWAAEQMNISQPAMTHQIQTLETELNVKLFRRSTRLVELTPEGRSFLSDARSMVAIAAQAKRRFQNPDGWPMEALTIGCTGYSQLERLSGSLMALAGRYPKLHPRLITAPYEQLCQLLENGTADVIFGIRGHRETREKWLFQELRKSPTVCVCRRDHPLAGSGQVTRQALLGQALIFCSPINLLPEMAQLQWLLAESRTPLDMHFCSSAEAACILAKAGFGMAILPDFLVPPGEDTMQLPLAQGPSLSYGLFYKSYPGDGILREFVELTREHFSQASSAPPCP